MNSVLKYPAVLFQAQGLYRALSISSALNMKAWRVEQGLPVNRTAEGILTEGPDFTYLDGRPTPLMRKQMKRVLKQREYATKMVQMSSELDFAKARYQKMEEARENERQQIINSRLKPKGEAIEQKRK